MKTMKTLPVISLLLILALAACVPATAVPEQQTPIINLPTETPFSTLSTPTLGVPTAVNPTLPPVATLPIAPLASATPVFPTVAPTLSVPNTGATVSPTTPTSYAALYTALAGMSNITVQQQGAIQQPYFDVQAQLLSINGQQVQVFEFNSVSARQEAQNTISNTGSTIGNYVPSFVSTPHFWSSGRMLVLYVGQDQQVISSLDSVLGTQINNPLGVTGTPVVNQQILTQAQQYLATLLGVNISQVQLVSVQQEQWPNACLGLPQSNETCAQVVTPGYQVVLRVNGQLYQVRTDTTGQTIRVTQGQAQ